MVTLSKDEPHMCKIVAWLLWRQNELML